MNHTIPTSITQAQPMKICDVVINSVWHDPRVRKQIISYKQAGIDVVCIGVKDNRYSEQAINNMPCLVHLAEDTHRKETRHKFRFVKRAKTFFKMLQEIRDVRNLILKTAPDIIHANDLNALIPSYLAAKKLGCKLIYDSHEICLDEPHMRSNKLLRLFYGYYEKKIIHQVDAVVCVSHAAAEYLAKYYGIPKPTVVTNCCISSETVSGEYKNPRFEALNHGYFNRGRGYDIMVEASPLLKDYPEIKLALRGLGLLEEQLHNRAKELSATNVIFYPKVRVEELIPLASHSMVGIAITENICLNFELSVSNKLFEYAAAGLPIIMSDIPEHRYLNDKYNFGIIINDNTPQTLAAAIIHLYSNTEFYQTCRQNAIRMSTEMTWENEFGKLLDIERSLLKQK